VGFCIRCYCCYKLIHFFFNQAKEIAVPSEAAIHLRQAGGAEEGGADVGYVGTTSK
jgi:hypothetical protein